MNRKTRLFTSLLLILCTAFITVTPVLAAEQDAYASEPAPDLGGFRLDSHLEEYTPEAFAEEVVLYTNRLRQANGLSPLEMDPTLNEVAMERLTENNGEVTHVRPDGSKYHTVMQEFDTEFNAVAENIIFAPATPAWIVEYLSNSPGHRRSMLSGQATHTGVSVQFVDTEAVTRVYVVQFFAN